jgi:hypothetical protein
MQNGR